MHLSQHLVITLSHVGWLVNMYTYCNYQKFFYSLPPPLPLPAKFWAPLPVECVDDVESTIDPVN